MHRHSAVILATLTILLSPALARSEDGDERQVAYWSSLRAIYNQRVTLTVDQKPLPEVATLLAEQLGLPVLIDEASLDDLGIDAIDTLSGKFVDIPLHEVMRLLLRPLELACSYDTACLTIVSDDEAEVRLTARVYPVGDLLGSDCADFDGLLDLIVSTVAVESWAENGGGEAEVRPLIVAEAIVVSQTAPVHLEIEDLLDDLRWAMRVQEIPPGGNPRRVPCPPPWMNVPGMGGAAAEGVAERHPSQPAPTPAAPEESSEPRE